jgi:hypothetical protein
MSDHPGVTADSIRLGDCISRQTHNHFLGKSASPSEVKLDMSFTVPFADWHSRYSHNVRMSTMAATIRCPRGAKPPWVNLATLAVLSRRQACRDETGPATGFEEIAPLRRDSIDVLEADFEGLARFLIDVHSECSGNGNKRTDCAAGVLAFTRRASWNLAATSTYSTEVGFGRTHRPAATCRILH